MQLKADLMPANSEEESMHHYQNDPLGSLNQAVGGNSNNNCSRSGQSISPYYHQQMPVRMDSIVPQHHYRQDTLYGQNSGTDINAGYQVESHQSYYQNEPMFRPEQHDANGGHAINYQPPNSHQDSPAYIKQHHQEAQVQELVDPVNVAPPKQLESNQLLGLSTLIGDMQRLMHDDESADIIFLVDDDESGGDTQQPVHAHRALLKAR